MDRRRAVTAALCGASVGLGLWASGGSMDHVVGPHGPVRVAMLPSLATLAGLMVAVALAAVAAVAGLARGGAAPRLADVMLDALRPLAGAGLLVLPWMPVLPEWMPALLLLTSPGVIIWWVVIGAATLHTVVAGWLPWPPPPVTQPAAGTHGSGEQVARRRRWTTAILLMSLLASGLLAQRFVRTALYPGGDEPHYLIIAQSVWRDGDLRIENNHTRRDYDEYFNLDLTPHYLTRGVDGEIYSIHPIGMPVLVAPVYAAGGYEGVVLVFVLLGGAALTMAWRLAWAVTGSASAATFGWAVLAFGVPWVFNTFSIYPEVPAAFAVTAAYTLTAGWQARQAHVSPLSLAVWRFVAAGVLLATLPWLSTKYVVMAFALGVLLLARVGWPWPAHAEPRQRAVARALAITVPCAVSLAGWFAFFNAIWGTYSPSAPYGIQRETRLSYLPSGGPGLLFDQEYGIVLFAPALLMVIPGLWVLWRQRGGRRRICVELLALWAGLIGVVGAFHIWWGGSAIVGRPVVSAMPLLLIPMAAHWAACAAQPWRRASHVLLLAVGVGLTVLMATAQNGLLLAAGRDGASQVLEYLTPSASTWTVLPTFLRQAPEVAGAMTAAWLLPLLAAGWLLGVLSRRVPGTPGQAAAGAMVAGVVCVSLVSGAVQAAFEPSTPPVDLTRRARVRLLDEFDPGRRPLALQYGPLTGLDPATVPGLFPLVVNDAGQRSIDANTLLFGRRLSLPAGRYALDVVFPTPVETPIDGALAVRVGRVGPPYERWPISVTPPGSWGRGLTLPVDVGFVGIEASPDVVAAGPQIRLTPQAIVPLSQRPAVPAVLGAGRYGDTLIFVHGDDAWPEPDGVWVRGRATAALTVIQGETRPLTLRVRAGARAVDVSVRAGDQVQRMSLPPGQHTDMTFPAGELVRQLDVTSSDGFVPAEVEAGSRDRRVLGVWLELR
jgi:hypothetical protein